MSLTPRRRLLDQFGGSPTFIAEGSRFKGDVETAGACVASGEVEGNGRIGGPLCVSAGATWRGDVTAQSAVVNGTIIGQVAVAQKLEIGSAAVIRGSIAARTVAIAKGAIVEGEVTVMGGQPVVHFEEKREPTAA
jgi:cytoskeletal protein CcmA (bactofilin family)